MATSSAPSVEECDPIETSPTVYLSAATSPSSRDSYPNDSDRSLEHSLGNSPASSSTDIDLHFAPLDDTDDKTSRSHDQGECTDYQGTDTPSITTSSSLTLASTPSSSFTMVFPSIPDSHPPTTHIQPRPRKLSPSSLPNSGISTPKRGQTPSSTTTSTSAPILSGEAVSHKKDQSHGLMVFPTTAMTSTLSFSNSSSSSVSSLSSSRPNISGLAHSTSTPTTPSAGIYDAPSSNPTETARTQQEQQQREQEQKRPPPEKVTYTLSDRTSTLIKTSGQIPPPLIGASTTIHNNRLFVFGGRPEGMSLPTNDIYVLDLDSHVWTRIDPADQEGAPSQSDDDRQHPLSLQPDNQQVPPLAPAKTSVPQPRYFHSAVLVPAPPLVDTHGVLYGWGGESGAHLIVFGGRGFTVEESVASEVCLSDAHILDLDTLHWIPSSLSEAPSDVTLPKDIHESKSKSKSTAPSFQDASEHQASSTAASVSSSFSLPAAPHNPYLHHQPPPRYRHIAALSGDHMVVIGGKGLDDTSVTQISVLDLRRHIWMNGGQFHGECDYRISAMAGAVETPMARRRRRYTECLATEGSQVSGQTNSSTGSEPSQRTSSLPIGSELMHPLLNPRKNSWYRGEGRPFELPALDDVQRQRLMSDSELLMDMERDDAVWSQQAKLQGNLNLIQAHGMLGLGMDPEISRAMAQSAGVAMTAENAVARARQSSTGTIKTSSSTHGSHSGSSEKSPKQRSSSRVVAATLTAAPPKMFTKGSNGLLDLDGLATTYARQQPKALSPRAKESTSRKSRKSDGRRKAHSSRETIARTSSRDSTKSNRDSWTSDSTRKSGSLDGEPTISDRRRSLPGEYPVEPEETTKSGDPPPPTNTSQPLFLFSSYRDSENKDRQEFLRIQSSTEACQPGSESVLYDVKPEWVASSMGYRLLAGAEDMTPPKMLFPVGYMIDRQFLLSGSFDKTSRPNSASSATLLNESQDHATNEKQRAFSVWIHHFSNHQWTQLELSKTLKLGTWDHSVLDRTDNMLYILGRRGDGLEEDAEMEEPTLRATFTHLVKVDLEGFEVCPGIDEPSVGPAGIKLGLEMLRDGIGADVAIVSAADGGRVWVNSGIVGQRWGHFQKLLESREEARRVEIETIQQLNKAVISEVTTTSDHEPPAPEPKKPYLEDDNVEIIVPETTPILVGFLQYIYTNELSTPHQQRLKTLQGLLLIAHLYDLTRLRQLVRRALYNQLNASNAPAICETAVLTNEFGLQTRALRTLLQSARLAQLRQQAEESEAKRRLEFAVSRMEEMEESRIRIASLQATQAVLRSGYLASASRSGSMPMSGSQRSAANSTPTNTSANSTPGLASIGRFFRSREDSEVSTPNAPVGLVISGPAAAAAPIYTPEIMEMPKGIASSLGSTRMRTTSGTGQGATGSGTPGGSTNQQQHLRSKTFHHGSTGDITSVDSVEVHWQKGSTLPSNALPPAPPTSRSSSTTNTSEMAPARTLLSTAGRAQTAPMGAPPASAPSVQIVEGMGGGYPSPGPLTFSQKLHRKLSINPHPSAALDYFRPSHYHHHSSTSMSQTHDSSSPGVGQDVVSPGYGSEGGSTSHHNNQHQQHQQHQPPTYNPRHSLSSSSIDSEVNNGTMGRTGGGEIGYAYASSGTASGSVASSSTRSLASSLHEGNPGKKRGHARSASLGGKGHRRTDSSGSGGFFSKAATSLHAHGHGHGHGGNTSSSGSSSNGSSFLGGLSLSSGDRGSKKSLKKAEKAEKERQRRLEDQRRKTQKTVHVSNTVNASWFS